MRTPEQREAWEAFQAALRVLYAASTELHEAKLRLNTAKRTHADALEDARRKYEYARAIGAAP